MNFWRNLKKPFFVLAPMDEVTDTVCRQILADLSKPDVFFTEFVNVEGLTSKGFEPLSKKLQFSEKERPIVAQIWGKNPENYFAVAQMVKKMGFDGIDINMGCPDRQVVKNGCCSALIENPELAGEIIKATIKGADGLPVSVKTRLGLTKLKTEEWFSFLLKFDLSAITVHGRLAKDMSKYPADWQEISKVVNLRDEINPDILIVGNGDIANYEDGLNKAFQYGVDGLMIGRGIFQDLWAFTLKSKKPDLNKSEMLKLLVRNAELFNQTWGEKKHFLTLRKFFKVYLHQFSKSDELRLSVMGCKDLNELKAIVADYQRM